MPVSYLDFLDKTPSCQFVTACVVQDVCVVMGLSIMILFLILFLIYDDKRNFIVILSQQGGQGSSQGCA